MMENRFYYCEHCGEKVSKTLYYQHKKLYYTVDSQQWEKNPDEVSQHAVGADTEEDHEDFTFSDHERSLVGSEEGMEVDGCTSVELSEDSNSESDFDFDRVSEGYYNRAMLFRVCWGGGVASTGHVNFSYV